uniref:Uncharacterized protein n=1 Tax=Solibacter usitatus (strain Ellin6076) TaxID=234267 RepID=Q023K2_SOLUE
MSKSNPNTVRDVLKRAGFSDEFVADALRQRLNAGDHTDMGSGHSDFPKHQDLHLDIANRLDSRADAVSLTMSLELREGLNEWVRLIHGRIADLEKRLESLEKK